MEEGKIIATASTVWSKKTNQYIYKCCTDDTLLAWGRFGSISAPFGEPASRFGERSGKMER
jgi:hypothetical protein